jgi:Cu-Zn family superoxide dismutase
MRSALTLPIRQPSRYRSTMHRRHLLLFCTLVVPACRTGARVAQESPAGTVVMRSASGASLGTLRLDQTGDGVRVRGTLTGLAPGVHGIHFHTVGRCDPPGFASAGPHFNPTNSLHGLQNPLGPHAGDLPNITVNVAGQAVVDLTTTRATFDPASPRGLVGGDGTALIVHADPDDQHTDPSGNSGARIACGVVRRD